MIELINYSRSWRGDSLQNTAGTKTYTSHYGYEVKYDAKQAFTCAN